MTIGIRFTETTWDVGPISVVHKTAELKGYQGEEVQPNRRHNFHIAVGLAGHVAILNLGIEPVQSIENAGEMEAMK